MYAEISLSVMFFVNHRVLDKIVYDIKSVCVFRSKPTSLRDDIAVPKKDGNVFEGVQLFKYALLFFFFKCLLWGGSLNITLSITKYRNGGRLMHFIFSAGILCVYSDLGATPPYLVWDVVYETTAADTIRMCGFGIVIFILKKNK